MLWKGGRRSDNVEDQRSAGSGRGLAGGGIGVVVIAVIAMLLGVDPSAVLNQMAPAEPPPSTSTSGGQPVRDELSEFVSVVLADTEDTWQGLFKQLGGIYREPKLVLFSHQVRSACGFAQAATGPFYCPADQKVYLDLVFFRELKTRFQAPGDFAQAYVIAHEVGHHVQNLLGISEKVHQARSRTSETQGNTLSVRLELQADCFAGIWANHAQKARQIIEQGDIEEALQAASSIGDDRLQMQSKGYVVPDGFTHGSSEQRVRWFKRGIESGNISACDTFKTRAL
ncbi:MAG: zinc metallopeptidase [Burkholderiales bacterium]|nr:zinc metallopeptidase [Burkholderiales bacterium]